MTQTYELPLNDLLEHLEHAGIDTSKLSITEESN